MPKPHVICYLRQILAEMHRTQDWLAEELDMDPATLNRIIKGYRNPRATFAGRVGRLLNKRVDEIWPFATPKRRK